jgi:hypothetical protein
MRSLAGGCRAVDAEPWMLSRPVAFAGGLYAGVPKIR